MKNRTIIGILCIVAAVAVTFVISPLVNNFMSDTVKVVSVTKDIDGGGRLEADNIQVTEINRSALPHGAITDPNAINGYFVKTKIYSGDILTAAKITPQANNAEDVLRTLNGNEVAVSFTIDSFAAGLSGKLQNGDIISLIVTNKASGKTEIPAELKYVRVVTTTTSAGIDRDSVKPKEDGTTEPPSTVTVLATVEQAKLIASYEAEKTVQAVLVYRGDKDTAQQFLDKQTAFLNSNTRSEDNE